MDENLERRKDSATTVEVFIGGCLLKHARGELE